MDWALLFGGGAFGLMLVGTTSGFVYLIMRLITNPLKEDMDEMKISVKGMSDVINDKLKSEEDLIRLIQQEVVKHERACPARKGK